MLCQKVNQLAPLADMTAAIGLADIAQSGAKAIIYAQLNPCPLFCH
jgi:hypothetical protein